MIESLVRAALKQRLIVAVIAAVLFFFGLNAAQKLSVDAFPDVTNIQVQIATEAPGRSPEEVERFATVPLEVAMTGLPGLEEMRSLNKPGLSLWRCTGPTTAGTARAVRRSSVRHRSSSRTRRAGHTAWRSSAGTNG